MASLRSAPFLVRLAVGVVAFLLVGFVLNALVAWGCAQAGSEERVGGRMIRLTVGYLKLEQLSGFGMEGVDWFSAGGRRDEPGTREVPPVYPAWVPRWSAIHTLSASDLEATGEFQRSERAFGWPWLAFRHTERWVVPPGQISAAPATNDLPISTPPSQENSLAILWNGFAINMAIYSFGPWLLLVAPFQLTRLVRRMLGRCPHCNYPVGVSPVCTECGKSLPVRR